ncbi:secretion system protein E [Candidatus Saccharibacteria bacterium 47-87]|nr:type II/IV secretion system protein [Candidatus Saccharibacteria bacterium]OJU97327.1 MAG: secretion system protein E [Candidatus Saccharibacteria bacterium 47-87]
MRISDNSLETLLGRANLVTPEQLASLKDEAARSKRPLLDIVYEQKAVDEKTLVQAFAEDSGIPYTDIDARSIPTDVLQRIPERVARQYMAVLFKIDDDGVHHLAMEDPDDVQAVNFIQKEIGTNSRIYIATRDNILAALDMYRGDVDKELNEVIEVQRVDENTEKDQLVSEKDIAEDSPIAQTVNLLLEYAIRSHASDIHIEPREEYVQVRYRVDGILKEVNRLPRNVLGALVSRIKILSNLKIDERRVPQDGRFKTIVGGRKYALRVSTLPIADGEKVVMRILDESSEATSLDHLGYWGKALTDISREIHDPDGIVLMTGPTGSGKSTSLFSILSELNTPSVNISTIEDPVEYKIKGVNQTQTNAKAGMTFVNGLRALLRQDPNIIMVGEIRDGETANLAIQAALTGHMVFSTLHTNNAATTLPRLLDMGIEPFLIASTIRAVVGQRLIRRLHVETRQSYVPSPEEKAELLQMFHIQEGENFKIIHELEKQALAAGLGEGLPLSTDEHGIKNLWRADKEANTDDVHEGYRGRLGIYEVLYNSSSIQKLIMARATSDDIQQQAVREGMVTMQLDGFIKALRGETTIEEVLRVTRE